MLANPTRCAAFRCWSIRPNPGEFLRNCLRLLKPGGTLIASVPNSEGFLRDYDELLDFPPHHMTQWNRATFEALQSHFGVRLAIRLPEPLAANHVEPCVSAWSTRLRSRGRLGAALASRRSSRLMTNVLQRGGRYLVRGHTLYCEIREARLVSAPMPGIQQVWESTTVAAGQPVDSALHCLLNVGRGRRSSPAAGSTSMCSLRHIMCARSRPQGAGFRSRTNHSRSSTHSHVLEAVKGTAT